MHSILQLFSKASATVGDGCDPSQPLLVPMVVLWLLDGAKNANNPQSPEILLEINC